MMTRSGVFGALPEDHREELMSLARLVTFPMGTRVFEEGGRADRFWIIHTGSVSLDVHVPGRQAAVVETLGAGDLLGWSWLLPPHRWHLGAETTSPVRAHEFDAAEVRKLCERDPIVDHVMLTFVAGVIANRLRAARTRLLDLYAPYGSGGAP